MRRPLLLPLLIGLLAYSGIAAAQTAVDAKMRAYGLIDIADVDSTILVDMMYSRKDNFMKEDAYGDFATAYFAPPFAARLRQAQALLHEEKGERYSIIIYDAARPLSIQQRMWDLVKGTPDRVYVSPVTQRGGGRHNYGVAVDMSLYDTLEGRPIDMGSPVDHFGISAHIDVDETLLKEGLVTPEALEWRHYLFSLMRRVGLRPIRKEWWHFQESNSIVEVRQTYRLLDF